MFITAFVLIEGYRVKCFVPKVLHYNILTAVKEVTLCVWTREQSGMTWGLWQCDWQGTYRQNPKLHEGDFLNDYYFTETHSQWHTSYCTKG